MSKNKATWIAFGLLSVLCFIVFKDYLLLKKAYLFYDISSDGFYGTYPFLSNLSDYIAHYGIPQWSFKVGMGQNIFPFMLRDPFDIFLYLAGKENIIPLTIYIEVFKIILTGMIFYKYLKLLNLSDYIAITGSLLFSFCGFITEGSAWFIFTFEAFNFTLLLYAFELFLLKKRWFLLSFAVFLLCISMPFNLYVYGLFLAFYAIFRYLQTEKFDFIKLMNLFAQMLGITLVGILLSGPFLLQIIWLLLHSPRGADTGALSKHLSSLPVFALTDKLQLGTSIMRFFSNDILGSGDNFKGWGNHIFEAPLFYCGLPCLLLLPQVFIFLNRKLRIAFIIFFTIWILPIFFPYFRHAFWLFTGNYYRAYSFFVAFIFIYYSVHALEFIFRERKISIAILSITLVVLLLLLCFPIFIDKHTIDKPIQQVTAIFLIAYSIILILICRLKNSRYLKYVFILVLFAELGYTGWISANRRTALTISWMKNEKVLYNDYVLDAVRYIQAHDKSFYRIDRYLEPHTSRYSNLNFNQQQGYNSTTSYSSFNQLYYIRYLQTMGIVAKDKETDTRWAIGLVDNPLLESQNRVKYYLGTNNMHPLWPELWDSLVRTGDVTIFKNKYVLPVGYTYGHYIKESNFSLASPLQKQFITMRAFVISDKDANKAAGLKEFKLNDTLTGPLNFDAFKNDWSSLVKDTLSITEFKETKLTGDIDLNESKMIYLSIPYDDGWQLIVDGIELKPVIINGGMTGVLLDKGHHHVELFYKLRFMFKGGLMSLLGLIILFTAILLKIRKQMILKQRNLWTEIKTKVKNKKIAIYLIALIVFPVIIYLYFLKWKNGSIHDDDLFIFKIFSETHGFWNKINLTVPTGIFRPVQGLSIYLLITYFQKHFLLYYLFNVLVQTINTLLFARVLNLILKSPYLSLLLSLILGLSRFSYYSMTQFYNGGGMEGLAITFFLLFLYSIVNVFINNDLTAIQKQRSLYCSILFANLCLYTHERYMVLLPFVILITLFYPGLKSLTTRQKSNLVFIASALMILPFLVKKFVFSMPLFMGTGYTTIAFSFSSIRSLLIEAVLNILQINTAPAYISGMPFSSLPLNGKIPVLILAAGILLFFIFYTAKVIKAVKTKDKTIIAGFYMCFSMVVLFFMLLAPLVIQIRVEQRWMKAPLIVFIVIVLFSLESFQVKNSIKNTALVLFTILFLWSDHIYLYKGAKNFYFSTTATIGSVFDRAIKQGVIHRNNTRLYVFEKHRNPDRETEINWALAYGYFFELYQDKSEKIVYVDSTYQKTDSGFVPSFPNFSNDSEQIIFLNIVTDDQTFKYTITDITNAYLNDSLKTFMTEEIR